MHRRKLLGILKYGERKRKNKKFQTGGSITASSAGYDWRDDPYEKQLAQERMARQKQAAKKTTATSQKFSSTFSPITGGLKGSAISAQRDFSEKQNAYFGQVNQPGGVEWANSAKGKAAYQALVNYGAQIQSRVTEEAANFKKAEEGLTAGDKEALAIFGDENGGTMFVKEGIPTEEKNEDGTFKMQGVFREIAIADYERNQSLAADDKNRRTIIPQNIASFMHWKKNLDMSGNSSIIDKYMKNGASSMETFYKENAAALLKASNYSIDKDSTTLMGEHSISFDDLKDGIKDMINGGTGNPSTHISSKNVSNSGQVAKVIDKIYTEAMRSGIGGADRMNASLRSEVFKDKSLGASLRAIRSDPKYKTERDKNAAVSRYIDGRMKVALVNRLVFAEKLKVDTKSTPGSNDKVKSNADDLTAALVGNVLSGTGTSKYEFSRTGPDGEVDGVYNTTGVKDVIRSTDMELDKYPTLETNKKLRDSLATTDVYLEDGSQMVGDDAIIKGNDIRSRMVLPKNANIDVVYLPTVNGEPVAQYFNSDQFIKIRKDSRDSYIKAYTKMHGKAPKYSSKDLMNNNNTHPNAAKEYRNWIAMGKYVSTYQSEFDNASAAGKTAAKRKLEMAKAAQDAALAAASSMSNIMRGNNVSIMPYATTTVMMNDDGDLNIEEIVQKHLPDADISTTSADHAYMEDVVNKIPGLEGVGDESNYWSSDTNVKFQVYMPLKDAVSRNQGKNTLKELLKNKGMLDKIINHVMDNSITYSDANGISTDQAIKFIMN